MARRITCIKKDGGHHHDPHESISLFGWTDDVSLISSHSTLSEMVQFVSYGGRAYVSDRYGNIAYLEVMISSHNNKYVRTIPDSTMADNLLSLPECRY